MTKLKKLFARGTMDKDSDKSLIQKHSHRHAENLRFHTNDGNDGTGKNIKGTTVVADLTGGNTDFKCITGYHNQDKDVIYFMLATTNGVISKICEYNIKNDTSIIIAEDNQSILNLQKNGYITGIDEINGLLFWSEWGNNPRRINIERAKGYGLNGFTEDDIMLIVKPPLKPIKITLEDATTATQEENNIEEIITYYSYRWKYLDGEYSVLAPFSRPAYFPKNFAYDFAEQSNPSMVNKFNQVLLEFNTGNERVVEIQLVFKESQSNTVWIIDDFNKALLDYDDNQTESFAFNNSKVKGLLSKEILNSYSDKVPHTNKAQAMIEGRLLLAHYTEDFDIKDDLGIKIDIDFSLTPVYLDNFTTIMVDDYDEDGNITGQISFDKPNLIPLETCKSNRDYEAGVIYTDGHGRNTTILISKTNTLYIPNSQSITGNSIDVILKHKPPFWATNFRFFVTQAKRGYDQILPTLFYEDGRYRWVKLEGADKDKVKEGDYLIVKSDSQTVIQNLVKVKVLEVTSQEKNFLQVEALDDEIIERSGLYFKIKPKNFRLDFDDFDNFHLETYDNTRNAYNSPINDLAPYIGYAHWYGDQLNDMTSGGSYTGANDERNRYLIKIDGLGTVNGHDTFKWSDDDGANFNQLTVEIIVGTQQALNKGVHVVFANDTGHSENDEWNVNARSTWTKKNSGRAYGFFRTVSEHNELLNNLEDEVIQSGARILLEYNEYGRGNSQFTIDIVTSGRYDNIQEWFYKENILASITSQTVLVFDDIHFMRGVLRYTHSGTFGATEIIQDDINGTMTMCIRSAEHGTASSRVKVRATTDILQTDGDQLIIFETEPIKQPPEIWFEISKTYDIINNYHISDSNISTDIDQSSGIDLRVKLDFFNAFSYGNAVESYKIKDDFNSKGLDIGVRPLSTTDKEFKRVTRVADITWSDLYNDEADFNGLSTFNVSVENWVKLDKESGSIQKIYNDKKNLLVLQEDALGLMPYNRSIIQDAVGGKTFAISKDVLNKDSYQPYAGIHGISKEPEGFIAVGNRKYFPDKFRGDWIRLSTDGVTTINQNFLEHEFSDEMIKNKANFLIGGYDPKHKEVLLNLPESQMTLSFKDRPHLGFPNYFTFQPDFMLHADNELYAWKKGIMYKLNDSATRNNFFGVQYESKIKFFFNESFDVEKVWNALGIRSTHAWLVNVKTDLTSRQIPKDSFVKNEDFWFSEIMGNTNGNALASSIFGIGTYVITNGEIITDNIPPTLSVGDSVTSKTLPFASNKVADILSDRIVLENSITEVLSFLMYSKNQNIDGSPIRGDVLEVEMINDDTEEVILRGVSVEISKSEFS